MKKIVNCPYCQAEQKRVISEYPKNRTDLVKCHECNNYFIIEQEVRVHLETFKTMGKSQ